jgi:hypothetical protein
MHGEHTPGKALSAAAGPPILRSRKTRAGKFCAEFAAQHEAAAQALMIAQADLSTWDFFRRAIGRCLTDPHSFSRFIVLTLR